jgi:small-conductance mechanosensitive channel
MKWEWLGNPIFVSLIGSVILILMVIFLRMLLMRAVLGLNMQHPETRRRWIVHIRNFSILTVLVGLILIWGPQLWTLALSLAALAVAFVIAIKELILCVSGAVVRAASKSYSVGDRIEINGKRGDVVDQDLFTTTLLEIGPGQSSHQYTGRAIVIPNSLLLNTPLINETFTEEFVLHVFCVPLNANEDWQRAEQILLEAAHIECSPFLEDARTYMKGIESKHGLDSPTVAPRVTLQIPEPDKINLLLRVPAPARRKGRLEQAILRRYLSELARVPLERFERFPAGMPDRD